MCGIFGFYSSSSQKYSALRPQTEFLFRVSNSRGKEASGISFLHGNSKELSTVSYIKTDSDAIEFLKSVGYKRLMDQMENEEIQVCLGHARMTTHGTELLEKNNQPVFSKHGTVYTVHNGIVTNFKDIWKQYFKSTSVKDSTPALDTQVIVDVIEKQKVTNSLDEVFCNVYHTAQGVLNLATVFPSTRTLVLSSNTGSLYWLVDPNNTIFFASEKVFLKDFCKTFFPSSSEIEIHRVNPMHAVIIQDDIVQEIQLLKEPIGKIIFKSKEKKVRYRNVGENRTQNTKKIFFNENDINVLRKHDFDYERINNIPRCSKCILPRTTPFITFDKDGICNYCLDHTKIEFKGKQSLEKILEKYRKNTDEPDCLIAFSGGRDSSYGLHLIKKELGMNPLAYTYDWGMISDLGRRNQARMLGAMGVEQILVSADIPTKRKHIRENILAWMKKPHLGMIPLFMEGDKQCEFYADQVMKKYNLKLMIYCRGNELEREEFKAGHCGVRDADPGGVIHNLAIKNKLKLLQFYGSQYLLNPAYINSSFLDTAFAYFSTYIQPHNFAYLWHYLPWEEEKINSILKNTYHWETSDETSTTWRIGDGTPAFYNYIYYQVQGFTENDSLRARQVREGIITRKKAMSLVSEENKPQYNNLKWYFDTLELDGDEVLSVVDQMRKLY